TGQLMAALTAWGHPSHSFPPVVVQAMAPAFTPEMLSGTLFTRHPATGIPMDPDDPATWYGKTLDRALGPDLTGGLRIPSPLNRLSLPLPSWALDLARWANRMEQAWGDALEIGFTVTEGRLVLLKAAPCHRTAEASLQIALDLTAAGWTTLSGGLDLVQPDALNRYLHPVLADPEREELFTTGLGVSPGSAVGQVVFLAQEAEELAGRGIRPILVCRETTPEDLGGLSCAEGILTATGGPTSHAAVVARGMGKCCVVGASQLRFNPPLGEVTAGDHTVRRLDWLSLDGNTGRVYLGAVPQVEPRMDPDLARLLKHADTVRKLGVYANADTPQDGAKALEMGAGGIGLCRTEHMFFHPERIPLFRKMILAGTPEDRLAALAALEPLQRDDFEQLFRVMNGRPVTIRLLDPPLHEFLPAGPVSQAQMAKAMGLSVETVRQRAENLAEANPMLGHRGCRLGITFPEIYLTQAKAIVEAACRAALDGLPVAPEIMIPLISLPAEFIRLKELILPLCRQTMAAMGISVPLKIGTMIETPRATLCAGEIARHADFFSFGTNDLTQMTFGFSRDDSASFLPAYVEKGVLKQDPFVVLDEEGVGALVRMAVLAGRKANPRLTIGICGEHGGEPRSIEFSHRLGLDYVSCSPYRIPIARLASAQSALKYPG
ncbi:MAG: PEP-utilizing enzyme, partial [Deltaproteobacteria bacterium]|nr:PEP-utilizing enzyme [Deltaproteobacteria bacterium]